RALEGGFDLVGQQQLAGDFEVALGHIHADIAPGIDAVDRALESSRNPVGTQPGGQHASVEGGGHHSQQHHLAPCHTLNGSLARRGAKRPEGRSGPAERKEQMERRIFGLENEYGVTCTLRGQRRLSPDEVARYLFRRVVSWGRSSNVFLENGARLYLD